VYGLTAWIHYFRSGRPWLAWAAFVARLLVFIGNFLSKENFHFRAITGLRQIRMFGESVSGPIGVPTPWARLGDASVVLLAIFVIDAAIRLWRRGNAEERNRAVVIGGSLVASILLAALTDWLTERGVLAVPYFISLSFSLFIIAMGFELSRDLIRAARMSEELHENAESMALAARAAGHALWRWDIMRDTIWTPVDGRSLLGIADGGTISLSRFLDALHPDDRRKVHEALQRSMESDGDCRVEYRVALPDGGTRWITLRGQVEFNTSRQPVRMRGVSIDTTERRAIELELELNRMELTHLTRVHTLSELSGSLAHELNQPLGVILTNAQAAQDLIAQNGGGSSELSEILSDIVTADRRAGEVIRRLRTLMKRGDIVLLPLSLSQVIEDVLRLVHGDLLVRGVAEVRDLARNLPQITGDQVQLQQVVLNLVINAAEAMSANMPGERRLHISTSRSGGMVRATVRDEGRGLPENVQRLFEPFYTTKAQGLGMGLAICRSIIAAHRGKLWAEPHAQRGAVFHFELPITETCEPA
jgi:two-component system, LuxR family, sensor kinase FixL